MTTLSTAAYADAIPVLNKVTIAPHSEREVTILLKDHVGKEGRKKDARLIAFFYAQENMQEIDILTKLAEDEEVLELAKIALDLDDTEGESILEKLTLFDLTKAFMEAIEYRVSQMRTPEVQEAEKK